MDLRKGSEYMEAIEAEEREYNEKWTPENAREMREASRQKDESIPEMGTAFRYTGGEKRGQKVWEKDMRASELAHSIINQRRDKVVGDSKDWGEFKGTHSTWTITQKQADYLQSLMDREAKAAGEIHEVSGDLYFSLDGLDFTKYDQSKYTDAELQFGEAYGVEILGKTHDEIREIMQEKAQHIQKFQEQGVSAEMAIKMVRGGEVYEPPSVEVSSVENPPAFLDKIPDEDMSEAEIREAEAFLETVAPGSTSLSDEERQRADDRLDEVTAAQRDVVAWTFEFSGRFEARDRIAFRSILEARDYKSEYEEELQDDEVYELTADDFIEVEVFWNRDPMDLVRWEPPYGAYIFQDGRYLVQRCDYEEFVGSARGSNLSVEG